MLSFKTELKKAAVVIQSHASGLGGQSGMHRSLLTQKLLEDSLMKVADTQIHASLALMEWANDESGHVGELYSKLADLEVLHSALFKRYVQQIESARQCYKVIAKGEKRLHELKKDYDLQQIHANKVRKQVESSKKKKEKDKVIESLEMDLATAYSQESKAAEDFRNGTENHSKFKLQKIQEALRITQTASADFHKDSAELSRTQEKITQLFLGPNREEYLDKAAVLAMSNITNLAEELGIPRPISLSDQQAGASFKSHQALANRHSMPPTPVYMEQPEREIARPHSSSVDRPLPALPLYPSLPSGNSTEMVDSGELYSEQYYSYTDLSSTHPSGILINGAGNLPPPCPPRPASSLPGSMIEADLANAPKRNSAPVGYQVNLAATDGKGTPLAPQSSDMFSQEYMSLIDEGIYDAVGNLQVSPKLADESEESDNGEYMSLQGIRPDIAKAKRGSNIPDNEVHTYDNRLSKTSEK